MPLFAKRDVYYLSMMEQAGFIGYGDYCCYGIGLYTETIKEEHYE